MPEDTKEWYRTLKAQYPEELWSFYTTDPVDLTEIINSSGYLFGYMKSRMS